MTIVVAVKDPGTGTIYMNADTASLVGGDLMPMVGRKITRHGDMLIGGAGLKVLIDNLDVPPSGEEAIVKGLISIRVREVCGKYHEWTREQQDEVLTESPLKLLVAWNRALYIVTADGTISEIDYNFWAIGSMQDYAIGALEALRNTTIPAIEQARIAIISCAHGRHYRPGIQYEILESSDEQ